MNVGAPACGINAVIRGFTRLGITKGYKIIGIHEGFSGLVKGDASEIQWSDVRGWVGIGGSILGTRRYVICAVQSFETRLLSKNLNYC